MAGDEAAGGQVKDQATIHSLVKVAVEVIQRFLRITKLARNCATICDGAPASAHFVWLPRRRPHRRAIALSVVCSTAVTKAYTHIRGATSLIRKRGFGCRGQCARAVLNNGLQLGHVYRIEFHSRELSPPA